jgi:nitroreductase
MDVFSAIQSKRAIRQFEQRPLPREAVETILNAARLAQSSKNMQAWHFIAIQSKDTLQALSKTGDFAGHLAGAALAVAIITPDPAIRFNVMFDAGQAASYMQLAAWDIGIGSCLATIYKRDAARELLGYPEEMHIRIAISFGYPLKAQTRPAQKTGRRPFDEAVHEERWDPSKVVHNPFAV